MCHAPKLKRKLKKEDKIFRNYFGKLFLDFVVLEKKCNFAQFKPFLNGSN